MRGKAIPGGMALKNCEGIMRAKGWRLIEKFCTWDLQEDSFNLQYKLSYCPKLFLIQKNLKCVQ